MLNRTNLIIYLQMAVGILAGLAGMLFFANLQDTSSTPHNTIVMVQFSDNPMLDSGRVSLATALQNAGLHVIYYKQKETEASEYIIQKIMAHKPWAVICIAELGARTIFEACRKNDIHFAYTAAHDPVAAHLEGAKGVCDAVPGDSPWEMIRHCQKNVTTVGMLCDATKARAIRLTKIMTTTASRHNINVEVLTVHQESDIPQAVEALIAKGVQAIYIPSDELATLAIPTIVNIAHPKGVPVYGSEEFAVKNGAIAAYAYNREDLGKRAALLVLYIIGKSKKQPSEEMPPLQLYVHPDAQKLFPQLDFSPIKPVQISEGPNESKQAQASGVQPA